MIFSSFGFKSQHTQKLGSPCPMKSSKCLVSFSVIIQTLPTSKSLHFPFRIIKKAPGKDLKSLSRPKIICHFLKLTSLQALTILRINLNAQTHKPKTQKGLLLRFNIRHVFENFSILRKKIRIKMNESTFFAVFHSELEKGTHRAKKVYIWVKCLIK